MHFHDWLIIEFEFHVLNMFVFSCFLLPYQADAIQQCPAIIAPEPSLLLSVGIEKSFQFAARNLPFDATKVSQRCIFENIYIFRRQN